MDANDSGGCGGLNPFCRIADFDQKKQDIEWFAIVRRHDRAVFKGENKRLCAVITTNKRRNFQKKIAPFAFLNVQLNMA